MLSQEVLSSFNKGDEKAFRIVFEKYYKALVFYADKIVNNWQQAEDIVIISITELFKRHSGFTEEASIKEFLYKVVKNNCLNYLKRTQVNKFAQHIEVDEELLVIPMPEETYSEEQLVMLLDIVNNQFSPIEKKLMLLELEGYSNKEIAHKLNVPLNTIYISRFRVIKKLKSIFTK